MAYITVKEAAAQWGYSEKTIRKWCQEGLLSVVCKAKKKRPLADSSSCSMSKAYQNIRNEV